MSKRRGRESGGLRFQMTDAQKVDLLISLAGIAIWFVVLALVVMMVKEP